MFFCAFLVCSQEHILKFGGPSFWIIWMRLLSLGGAGRCNKCTVEKLGCEYESVYVQFWKIAQMISNHLKSTYLYTYYLLYESTFSSKSVKITDAHILCFFVLCFSLFFLSTYTHVPCDLPCPQFFWAKNYPNAMFCDMGLSSKTLFGGFESCCV